MSLLYIQHCIKTVHFWLKYNEWPCYCAKDNKTVIFRHT